jgi:hypothetical protein
MSSRTSAQPALPASEQAASDGPARSRKRIGLSRETPVVRVLQVSLGVALLGLWEPAAAERWPDPVLAKSPVQSWDYLAGVARSGEPWSNTRSTMTAVLIAWVLAGLAGVAGLALGLMPRTEGKVALATTLVFFIVVSGAGRRPVHRRGVAAAVETPAVLQGAAPGCDAGDLRGAAARAHLLAAWRGGLRADLGGAIALADRVVLLGGQVLDDVPPQARR